MVGTYEVMRDGKAVGQAGVEKQGLYYRFTCRCCLEPGKMLRLTVRSGGKEVDLGILVPIDDRFGMDKKLACKQFGEGEPEFYVSDGKKKEEQKDTLFHPVYPEEPFAHMARLKDAFLETKNGELGIVFREEAEEREGT